MKPDSFLKWFLGLSAGLNAVLVAGLLGHMPRAAYPEMRAQGPPSAPPQASRNPNPPAVSALSEDAPQPALSFQWSDLLAPTLAEYMANLRKIGCPEPTARDIISAELHREFRRRRGQLLLTSGFWKGGAARRADERAATARVRALHQEEKRQAQELFGAVFTGPSKLLSEDLTEQALVRWFLGPISEEKLLETVGIMEDARAEAELCLGAWGGLVLPADRLEVGRMEKALEAALVQAMGQPAYEEFLARACFIKGIFNSDDWDGCPVEAREIRNVYVVEARLSRPLISLLELPEDEQPSDSEALQTALEQVLGTDRAKDCQRARDRTYRQLADLVRDQGLQKDAADTVYELRAALIDEKTALEKDANLAAEERSGRLAEAADQVRQAIIGRLGARAYQAYLAQGGAWMTNSAGL